MALPTYNLTTDVGKVRLVIGDSALVGGIEGVKPDGTNYSDAELSVFIDLAGSWKRAVSLALRGLANLYARHAVSQEIDGYKEDLSKIAAQLQDAAKQWDAQLDKLAQQAAEAPTVSWADCFGFSEAPRIFGLEQYGAQITDVA